VLTEDDIDHILRSPQAAHVDQMLTYVAVGVPEKVKAYLDDFAAHARADELMVVHQADNIAARLRSAELLAEAVL